MKLLIDDTKNYNVDIIARNGESGLLILGALEGNIETLYIDFDLGYGMNGGQVLVNAIENEIELPKTIIICSTLPQGVKILTKILLLSGGYEPIDKYEFRRG